MSKSEKPALLATVFTDYICPFCYIGDVRLDRLRDDYNLKINWCFLEIHPDTPATGMDTAALGYSESRWQIMMENLATLAAEEGITFRPHTFTTNSHKALLLAEAAKEAGAEIFYALHRRLFAAFFTEGQNIGDETTLAQLAHAAGVRDSVLTRAWTDDRYEQRLQLYFAAAQELDVRATPTVFFGEQQRIDGALPLSVFQKAASEGAKAQQSRPG
ncbi:MAG: DsbA family protein [Gammaproteobacteria bacterium]|jgi:predicted DsbA family dithiol-disulfide isomerase|nr:DsbA family protein [Gammaproteobacteria bacterium]